MTRTFRHAALGLALALASGLALAQATPVGLWKTIDDKTKKEKSLIRISESGGVLHRQGREAARPGSPKPTRSARSAPTTARTSRCSA